MDALRKRMSRLSAAVLRVSTSLDVDVVLQEVIDSARELTGARYGIITTIDEAGQPQVFITSGFTEEEQMQMAQWPDGPRLFEHFRNLPEAVRLDDLPDYARKLGFSARLMVTRTFQCTPMRCRGAHIGSFFPGEKEAGQAFTEEDEEVLVLFASQAATAIANARAHRDEQQARAHLEELDRSRAQFMALVSHELRTPLAAIKGSASTMLETALPLDPSEAEQSFRIIDEQADHMRGLIGDLLDAGRIAAGTLSVKPRPAELALMVEQARSAFLSGGGAHTILVDLPGELPRVLADERRIVQVLSNLFVNAARHSPTSSPIRVAAAHKGLHVAVSVTDKGRGVAAARLPQLFRNNAVKGGDGESGLGLSICKGLVEAHGGRIWANSAGRGRGTRFTFTVPVAAASPEAEGEAASQPDLPGENGARIPVLVVDDDPRALRFVRDVLARSGYSPITTAQHQKLPQIIAEAKPKLILLDLMLPGTDGIKLMESVPELADVPVIFISAYGRDETIAKALESGAVDYLVKPFSSTELKARIRVALRGCNEPELFVLGDLTIDYSQRRVSVAGRDVHLTTTEYELLRALSANAGQVVTFESLIGRMWRTPEKGDVDRVRTFVKQLRRKLGDDSSRPAYIVNVRSVGYRMGTIDNP